MKNHIYIYMQIQERQKQLLSRIRLDANATFITSDDIIDYIVECNHPLFYLLQSEVEKLKEAYNDDALFLSRLPDEFGCYYKLARRMDGLR